MTDWHPHPKQQLALEQSVNEIFYGGARGGGKTDTGMAFLMYDKKHPQYRGLVIRKNADDLKDWADRAERFYASSGATRRGATPEFVFPSGAIVRTGHLKDTNAYMKYQGHEYQKMVIEELPQIPQLLNYVMLIGSCRSSIPEIKPQVFATGNPDGPGHEWVKERFGIPDEPSDEPVYRKIVENGVTRWLVFIPARIEDNPTLVKADPGYVAYLDSLPDGLRQQWRMGSWADFDIKGAYYTNEIRQMVREKRYRFIPHDPMLRVHTVWDLGQSAGNAMALGFWQVTSMEPRIIAYYQNESFGFPHYFAKMQEYQQERHYVYGKHFAPFDINVKELSTGKTRLQLAKEAGWEFEVVDSLPIADGIEQARILMGKTWINSENGGKLLLSGLKQYRRKWSDERQSYASEPLHDWASNPADMFRYSAISFKKMLAANVGAKPKYRQKPYKATSPFEGGISSGADSESPI